MARIFTILFDYEGKTYNAMVGVRETHFHTEYLLNMLDGQLEDQLPSNKLYQSGQGKITFTQSVNHPETSLMQIIAEAVAEHLQLVQRP